MDSTGTKMGTAVYFTAPDGTVYRVLDAAWRNGKRVVANPPAPWANIRIFNPKSGRWRFYSLALRPHESREPAAELLARQFQKSEGGGPMISLSLADAAGRRGSIP